MVSHDVASATAVRPAATVDPTATASVHPTAATAATAAMGRRTQGRAAQGNRRGG
jgi:hypothetical protein